MNVVFKGIQEGISCVVKLIRCVWLRIVFVTGALVELFFFKKYIFENLMFDSLAHYQSFKISGWLRRVKY